MPSLCASPHSQTTAVPPPQNGWQRHTYHAAFQFIPLAARIWGYLPYDWLGGQDLPQNITIEWSLWGRHPGYVLSAGADFSRIRAPLRSLSFTDDLFASRRAVDELLGWYVNAEVERRHLSPRQVGMRSVGHFGFFKPQASVALWSDATNWLSAQVS